MFRVYPHSTLGRSCVRLAVISALLFICGYEHGPQKDVLDDYVPADTDRKVISYSLYGTDARYTAGAIENMRLLRKVYPGWEMRVYHDVSVPRRLLTQLHTLGAQLIDMTGDKRNPMTWRFLVASDPSVRYWCSRDIDARLSIRERVCVDIWLSSGWPTHIIRDHPSHTQTPIMGGTWCGTNQSFPEMASLLDLESIEHRFNADQEFLAQFVWPQIKDSVLEHVSFGCKELKGSVVIPVRRSGLEHVGAVFINGEMRRSDLQLLSQAIQNEEECVG